MLQLKFLIDYIVIAGKLYKINLIFLSFFLDLFYIFYFDKVLIWIEPTGHYWRLNILLNLDPISHQLIQYLHFFHINEFVQNLNKYP